MVASSSTTFKDHPISDQSLPKLQITAVLTIVAIIPFALQYSSKFLDRSPWLYRLIWGAAFVWNCITVSIPGRFDNQMAQGTMPWRTLFEPSGWAFAIWGVIYLGEALLSGYASIIGHPLKGFKDSSLYWLAGNIFQSLWCLTFRPRFKQALWLPALQLALSSVSYLGAYSALSDSISALGPGYFTDKILLQFLRFPVALHVAWLAAATLLNVNGWSAVQQFSRSSQISLAFSSAFLGAAVGLLLTLRTGDPLFAATVAWALAALASRTKERAEKDSEREEILVSQDTLRAIGLTETYLSKALQVIALGAAVNSAATLF